MGNHIRLQLQPGETPAICGHDNLRDIASPDPIGFAACRGRNFPEVEFNITTLGIGRENDPNRASRSL